MFYQEQMPPAPIAQGISKRSEGELRDKAQRTHHAENQTIGGLVMVVQIDEVCTDDQDAGS